MAEIIERDVQPGVYRCADGIVRVQKLGEDRFGKAKLSVELIDIPQQEFTGEEPT